MNRKKKTDSSEITIKVKRRYVRAKKEILLRESKYFQGLFSGNFSDSATTEINLSKVVDDMDIFKSVINFMATGYIFLSDENIQKVLHFSTFLLIDKLQKKCEEYLKDNLVCENWLKYHFYAIDNGLFELQLLTESRISSRFHDLLIFEEETLQLEPQQVKYLWDHGYLKFCTLNSLFLFIIKWLLISSSQHLDKNKVAVALSVLQNTQKDEVQTKDEQMVKELGERVKKLDAFMKIECKGNGMADQVLKILKQNVTECGDSDSHTGKNGVVPAKKVTAIFTVSERIYLRRKECEDIAADTDDESDDFELSDSDEIDTEFDVDEDIKATRKLDLCVFNKETDMWYHLGEFDEREYMRQHINYTYDFTKAPLFDMEFEITACDSHVIFVDDHALSVLIYNIRNKTWQAFRCHEFLKEVFVMPHETIDTMKFIVGRNNTVYLVVCVTIGYPERMVEIQAYEFNLESLQLFKIMETNPVYNLPECKDDWKCNLRYTTCHISESREEMIVAHYEGSGLNVVFTVNLANEKDEVGIPYYDDSDPREIFKQELDENNSFFKKVGILETKDEYLIFEQSFDGCLSVQFSYSFGTGTFTKVENGEKYKLRDGRDIITIVDVKTTLCEGSAFWQVEKKLRLWNVFKEIRYIDNGILEVNKHRPPPFTLLISVSSAMVDESFFQCLEPVNRFLCLSK